MPTFSIINRFLEDTCVIATLAYLISRGPLLPKLFNADHRIRDLILLAIVFGLAGGSELIFPGERYPYIVFTLTASFAAYAGGILLGALTSLAMLLLAALSLATGSEQFSLLLYTLSLGGATLCGAGVAKVMETLRSDRLSNSESVTRFVVGACIACASGETIHRLFLHFFVIHMSGSNVLDFYSVCSNAFAGILLSLILWDANQRYRLNARQIQVERQLVNLRLSQLAELQARLHPHFLFNALAGLAGLCVIDPRRAERGITDLAALLRRFISTPGDLSIPLRDELVNVRSYIAIEKLRLGDRLQVYEQVPESALGIMVPQFALLVPVENACEHGAAKCDRQVTVTIIVRIHNQRLTLVVSDDGAGIDKNIGSQKDMPPHTQDRPHGLTLLGARLKLAYGGASRIRLFRRLGAGATTVLRLPIEQIAGREG